MNLSWILGEFSGCGKEKFLIALRIGGLLSNPLGESFSNYLGFNAIFVILLVKFGYFGMG